jgi:Up-frameshift suppressor 2
MENAELMEDEEEEEVVLPNRNVEPEVDEEFNREFSRMMSEALESRKGASKSVFDVEPPTVRSRITSSNEPIIDPQRVQFAVLSRRNKQVAYSLNFMLIIDENSGNSK